MDTWAVAWTHRIGQNLRRIRNAKGLSAQAVANATAELGYEVPRNSIANLEIKRRRETVTVQELTVLALALDVSPMELLFDDASVELSPSAEPIAAPDAIRWFAGVQQYDQRAQAALASIEVLARQAQQRP